ncbi:MAG: hypothetical protein E7159_02025 [Firmicutes bacterium]|nr:hypothetical protein [Bacillota bacterium]
MAKDENYVSFIAYKKEKDAKKQQLETEKENLVTAVKNGYESYRDYEYAASKQLSSDPRFSLNRDYYKLRQNYLLDVADACLNYVRTGLRYNKKRNGESFLFTVYGFNELLEARDNKNEFIMNYVNKIGLDLDYAINLIKPKEEEYDELLLRTK